MSARSSLEAAPGAPTRRSIVINAVWRFIYTRAYITCLTIYIHARVYNMYEAMRDRGPSVDIGTCYGEYGRVRSSLRRRPPHRRHPADRKAAGWWGLTVTDDRCPESNTYTHWTGRQSIVSWKHLRNTFPVARPRTPRAYYNGVLHSSNSTPQQPRIHREMSRTYLPTTQVTPFIATDILTPLSSPTHLAFAPAVRMLRMLAFFMKRVGLDRQTTIGSSRITGHVPSNGDPGYS